MSLVVQVLACAGAVGLLAILVHGGLTRTSVAASTAAVATVVVTLLGAQGLWETGKRHIDVGNEQRNLPPAQLHAGGATAIGVDGGFVDFALAQVRPDDSFYILPKNDTVQQWAGFLALPRLAAVRREDADVLIFYNTTPRRQGLSQDQLTAVKTYRPKFVVARVADRRTP
jgi:hypothetical protein